MGGGQPSMGRRQFFKDKWQREDCGKTYLSPIIPQKHLQRNVELRNTEIKLKSREKLLRSLKEFSSGQRSLCNKESGFEIELRVGEFNFKGSLENKSESPDAIMYDNFDHNSIRGICGENQCIIVVYDFSGKPCVQAVIEDPFEIAELISTFGADEAFSVNQDRKLSSYPQGKLHLNIINRIDRLSNAQPCFELSPTAFFDFLDNLVVKSYNVKIQACNGSGYIRKTTRVLEVIRNGSAFSIRDMKGWNKFKLRSEFSSWIVYANCPASADRFLSLEFFDKLHGNYFSIQNTDNSVSHAWVQQLSKLYDACC